MAKKPILTLDIGSHSLKLAEFVEVKGGLEMTRYAVSDLGVDPQNDADRSQYIITTIHDLIRESGCKPGPVQVAISGHAVFSRFVSCRRWSPRRSTRSSSTKRSRTCRSRSTKWSGTTS